MKLKFWKTKIAKLEDECRYLSEKLCQESAHRLDAEASRDRARGELKLLRQEHDQMRIELDKANKQLRTQAEADLLMVSLQITQKLLMGESKENLTDLTQHQSALQQSLLDMTGSASNRNPFWPAAQGFLGIINR